jgi:anti-sigma B factor antagonist
MIEITATNVGGGNLLLNLVGTLDMTTAPRLRDEITAAVGRGENHVALGMGEVDFMDSTGLGAIIASLKTLRESGGDIRLVAPSWQSMLVIKMTNMDRVFLIVDSVEEAFQ